jgi:RND family efflux transporter MFP subunit
LQTLLGYHEDPDPARDDSQLSFVELRAPIDGTIESRNFSSRERLARGDGLFILANTTQLWVSADIREQEWAALRLKEGQELAITMPSLSGRRLVSHIDHIGREVNPETNAVPVVAVIRNDEGLLRPGQFAWVELPLEEPHSGLAVPESAVVEHGGQSFVFVSDGRDRFRKVDVVTGIREGDLVEIRGGLEEGDSVVIHGAFALKSELLLEREE